MGPADEAIFDRQAFISDVLQWCPTQQALELVCSIIQEDIGALQASKRTIMAENYTRFIAVKESLQKACLYAPHCTQR